MDIILALMDESIGFLTGMKFVIVGTLLWFLSAYMLGVWVNIFISAIKGEK